MDGYLIAVSYTHLDVYKRQAQDPQHTSTSQLALMAMALQRSVDGKHFLKDPVDGNGKKRAAQWRSLRKSLFYLAWDLPTRTRKSCLC